MDLQRLEDCARCGSCKAACPVYKRTLNEALSPRGRLMLVRGLVQGRVAAGEGLVERMNSCALCGLCDSSCPVGIKPTELIYKARALLRRADRRRFLVRAVLKAGLRRPVLGMKAARLFGGIQLLPPVKVRIPEYPLRGETQVIKPAARGRRGRVAVFAGCSANYLLPSVGEALINMLVALGYEVVLPIGEACCGVPLRSLGLEEEAVRFARKNLDIFGRLNVEAVISPCPTCVEVIKDRYIALLGRGVENAVGAAEFLAEKVNLRRLPRGGKILWHRPCHEKDDAGFDRAALFEALGVEHAEAGCCGFGLNLTEKSLAAEFLKDRVRAYGSAQVVATSCPACMMQLEAGGLRVVHIMELMEEAIFVAEEAAG